MRVDCSCWYASNKFDNAASVHPHRRAVSYTPRHIMSSSALWRLQSFRETVGSIHCNIIWQCLLSFPVFFLYLLFVAFFT